MARHGYLPPDRIEAVKAAEEKKLAQIKQAAETDRNLIINLTISTHLRPRPQR